MKKLLNILYLIILVSCSQEEPKPPRDILVDCLNPDPGSFNRDYWCNFEDYIGRYVILNSDPSLVYLECHEMPSYGYSFNTPIGWFDERDNTRGEISSLPFIRDYQKSCWSISNKEKFEHQLKILKLVGNWNGEIPKSKYEEIKEKLQNGLKNN